MHALKENAITEYNKALESLAQMRDAVSLIPDALLELPGSFLYHSSEYLRVDIAFTDTAFRQARKLLGTDWRRRKFMPGYKADSGDVYAFYVHKETGVELCLCLDAAQKYASCKRVIVGVKEVPIYEVVCL